MRIIESIKQGNKIVAYVVDCGSTTASITDKAEGVIKNSSDFKTTELSGDSAIEILKRADKGLTLKIKIGKYGNWKQVIFMGMIDDSKFRFLMDMG